MELVASLLDGATPLHCAALRGNAAQVRISSIPNQAPRWAAGFVQCSCPKAPGCFCWSFQQASINCACHGWQALPIGKI